MKKIKPLWHGELALRVALYPLTYLPRIPHLCHQNFSPESPKLLTLLTKSSHRESSNYLIYKRNCHPLVLIGIKEVLIFFSLGSEESRRFAPNTQKNFTKTGEFSKNRKIFFFG